jgi:uncharacterized membrane protein
VPISPEIEVAGTRQPIGANCDEIRTLLEGYTMSLNSIRESRSEVLNMPSGREAHSRSILKALSWRITGTIDTFVISLIVTGRLTIAGSIAGTELLTKIALYYGHERVWARIPWGRH